MPRYLEHVSMLDRPEKDGRTALQKAKLEDSGKK